MSRPKPASNRAGHNSHIQLARFPARAGVLEAPRHLGEVGREVWAAVWSTGNPYKPEDGYAIERYATLHDRREALKAAMAEEPPFVKGSTGQTRVHPGYAALEVIERHMSALETALLLTPEARARFGLTTDEVDDLDSFLGRG